MCVCVSVSVCLSVCVSVSVCESLRVCQTHFGAVSIEYPYSFLHIHFIKADSQGLAKPAYAPMSTTLLLSRGVQVWQAQTRWEIIEFN